MAVYSDPGTIELRNVLFVQCSTCVKTPDVVYGEHLTVDGCPTFANSKVSGGSILNSIFTAVPTIGPVLPLPPSSVNLPSSSGVYQTVGGGSHYLADDTHRNKGTTAINPTLLASLKTKSTHPPIIRTDTITQPETLSTQNRYVSGSPDLGYYYDAIDYAVDSFTVQQTSLTVSPGTVIASFGSPGIHFDAQAEFHVEGSPVNRVRFCDYRMVQEQVGGSLSTLFCCDSSRTVKLRFADFDVLIGGQGSNPLHTGSLEIADCAFRCPWATFTGDSISFRNNLFEGTDLYIFSPPVFFFQNNLVKGGGFGAQTTDEQQGEIKDNVFYGCTLRSEAGTVAQPHHHNALLNATVLHPAGWWVNRATDTTQTALTYEEGPLGRYYLPGNSPLVNAGSQSAAATGLYHYTTSTTQQKEAASIVDIGLHYVALDQNGNPIDTDTDGVPDYQEDFGGYIANVSYMQYHEAEPTIAVNPRLNASGHHDIYVFSVRPAANGAWGAPIGLMKASSTDGGQTWSSAIFATGTSPANLPQVSGGDPCAVYDSQGNLFLSYVTDWTQCGYPKQVVVAELPANSAIWRQVDGGAFITSCAADQPWLAVGPAPANAPCSETLWLCYVDYNSLKVAGAFVDSSGNVGSFAQAQNLPGPSIPAYIRHPRIAVGPAGQVMCVYQDLAGAGRLGYRFSNNGLAGTSSNPVIESADFTTSTSLIQPQTTLWNTTFHFYPALTRGVCNAPEIAWNRSRNRIYVAYADLRSTSALPNTDVYVQYADYSNQTMAWYAANSGVPIGSQDAGTAQFMPAIAVDQSSGNVAIGWYDGRNDIVNFRKVQYHAAVSRNGGVSFGQDFALTPGLSDASLLDWANLDPRYWPDFLDYTALSYIGGVLYAAWADNANSPVPNFSNGTSYLDIYVGFGTPPSP